MNGVLGNLYLYLTKKLDSATFLELNGQNEDDDNDEKCIENADKEILSDNTIYEKDWPQRLSINHCPSPTSGCTCRGYLDEILNDTTGYTSFCKWMCWN